MGPGAATDGTATARRPVRGAAAARGGLKMAGLTRTSVPPVARGRVGLTGEAAATPWGLFGVRLLRRE